MTVDLHIHTTASDGTASSTEIVRAACALRLRAIAITDHDSVEGIDPTIRAAAPTTLEVLPGVELSASDEDARDLHILGYFVDHTDPALLRALEDLRARRFERACEMVGSLCDAGYEVSIEGVLRQAGSGAVGRAHIARALVEAGDVETVEEAFRELIGRNGRHFIAKRLLGAPEAIAIIRGSGGVAVLAHPGVTHADEAIPGLVATGLEGLEAYHSEHTTSDRDRYAQMARTLGLVATGGSDYHGPNTRSGDLGSGGCPDSAVAALRACLGKRAG